MMDLVAKSKSIGRSPVIGLNITAGKIGMTIPSPNKSIKTVKNIGKIGRAFFIKIPPGTSVCIVTQLCVNNFDIMIYYDYRYVKY
jgi:hypothetical protein